MNTKSEKEKECDLFMFGKKVKELEALRREIERTNPNVVICAGYQLGYPEKDSVQVVGCLNYLSRIFDKPITTDLRENCVFYKVAFDGVEYFEMKMLKEEAVK